MIGRPLRIEWHEDDTPTALKEAYPSQRDVSVRTRLHGLWLIRSGWQIKAAAETVGVHLTGSAQRWVEWYRSDGLDEVVSRRMGGVGQRRYLNSDQEERLVEEVRSGRFRTAGEISNWVESEYGVRFKGNSIYSVFERLGCSPKVPPRLQLVYEWKYLFLVVDFVRGRLEWTWMDSMDSETVARAVLGMRRHTQVRRWSGTAPADIVMSG